MPRSSTAVRMIPTAPLRRRSTSWRPVRPLRALPNADLLAGAVSQPASCARRTSQPCLRVDPRCTTVGERRAWAVGGAVPGDCSPHVAVRHLHEQWLASTSPTMEPTAPHLRGSTIWRPRTAVPVLPNANLLPCAVEIPPPCARRTDGRARVRIPATPQRRRSALSRFEVLYNALPNLNPLRCWACSLRRAPQRPSEHGAASRAPRAPQTPGPRHAHARATRSHAWIRPEYPQRPRHPADPAQHRR